MMALLVLALVGVACAAPSYVVPHIAHGTVAVSHSHAPVAYAPPPAVAVAPVHPPASYITKYHAQDELGQVSYGFAHPGQAKNEFRDAYGNVVGSYSYIGADNEPVVVHYTAGRNGFQVSSNALPTGDALVSPDPVMDTPEVIAARKEFEAAFAATAAAAEAGAVPEVVVPEGAPSPVIDTPDVAAAKGEFIAAYNAAASALAHAEEPASEEEVTVVEAPVTEVSTELEEEPEAVTEAPEEEAEVETEAPEEDVTTEAVPTVAPEPEVVTEEVAVDPESVPEVVVTHGAPVPVMDTAEVAEAKAQFQAAYDAAAAAAAAAPDYDLDGSLSRYSGYLSAVDGSLSPLYTNTIPFGAYGLHTPLVHAKLPIAHAHGPVVHSHAHALLGHSLAHTTPLKVNPLNYATSYSYVHV